MSGVRYVSWTAKSKCYFQVNLNSLKDQIALDIDRKLKAGFKSLHNNLCCVLYDKDGTNQKFLFLVKIDIILLNSSFRLAINRFMI
jgi:hypothetical protein